jgi:hypothetical protein
LDCGTGFEKEHLLQDREIENKIIYLGYMRGRVLVDAMGTVTLESPLSRTGSQQA